MIAFNESKYDRLTEDEVRRYGLRSFIADASNPELRHFAERCGTKDCSVHTSRLWSCPPRSAEELRALSVGTTTAGGYTVPTGFLKMFEESLLGTDAMRLVATTVRTDRGGELQLATNDDTANNGEIVSENTAHNEQDLGSFGQIVMGAYNYTSKIVRISQQLVEDSEFSVDELVGAALGRRIGRIQNAHFTTGTGSGQPQGVVTASAVGKTGTTGQTTTVTYADLVDLQESIDPAYRNGAKWMLHANTLKSIKKLVDSAGMPIWQPALANGEPATILGDPYVVNNAMPVKAANAKSILYGQLSKYVIRDVREIMLFRFEQRYAELGQVGVIAFLRSDGKLLDAGTDPVKHYANSAT
jgi:HK97 family phage major capsid protein